MFCFRKKIICTLKELFPNEEDTAIRSALSSCDNDMNEAASILAGIEDGKCLYIYIYIYRERERYRYIHIYRVYKKKLNRFEIALNFAKHLFVSGFLYI